MLDTKDYRTTTEAAEALGRPLRVVLLWIKKGHLKAERAGRSWLIHKSEITRVKKAPPKVGRPRKTQE